MLPKALLTSHSRMSGSRWVITPLWLSGSQRSFLYSSSVYSTHLFLISSASLLTPSLHEMFSWYLYFLEEISSLSHSFLFLHFFALITGMLSYLSLLFFGTLHSNGYIFFSLFFTSLLFTAICKASSDSHFASLHFFFLGMVWIPVSCTKASRFSNLFFGCISALEIFFQFLSWHLNTFIKYIQSDVMVSPVSGEGIPTGCWESMNLGSNRPPYYSSVS